MKIIQRAMCIGIAAAMALPVAGTAVAQEGVDSIALLAQASGLSERQVQMMLGNRTSYAEYRISYDRVDRKFREAVGPEIYRDFKERGELTASDAQQLMAIVNAHNTQGVAGE